MQHDLENMNRGEDGLFVCLFVCMVVVVVLQFILRVGVFCPIWCVNFYPESRERESVCVRACVYVFFYLRLLFLFYLNSMCTSVPICVMLCLFL